MDYTIRSYKLFIILLIAILIANPIVTLLLFKSYLISTLILGIICGILLISYVYLNNFKWVYPYIVNILVVISIFLHIELLFKINYSEHIIEDLYTLKSNFYFNKPNLNKLLQDKEYSAQYITNIQGYRVGSPLDQNKILKYLGFQFL